MDIFEILPDPGGVLLLPAPLFQHWSPEARWTDRIHPAAIALVSEIMPPLLARSRCFRGSTMPVRRAMMFTSFSEMRPRFRANA